MERKNGRREREKGEGEELPRDRLSYHCKKIYRICKNLQFFVVIYDSIQLQRFSKLINVYIYVNIDVVILTSAPKQRPTQYVCESNHDLNFVRNHRYVYGHSDL